MAEVFGVVAAGVGLISATVELGASITKLKDLYQEYNNAPSRLLELVFEVDSMYALLSDLAAIASQDPSAGHSLLRNSTIHCRHANDQLSSLTDDLRKYTACHMRQASIAYILKKNQIQTQAGKLERCKSSLILACQSYTIHLAHEQHTTNRQQLSALMSYAEANEVRERQRSQNWESLVLIQDKSNRRLFGELKASQDRSLQCVLGNYGKLHQALEAAQRHKPPETEIRVGDERMGGSARTISELWRAQFARASLRWPFLLNVWSVLPRRSPVFTMCETGDLLGLQRLLCGQHIPLHVKSEAGWTLFAVGLSLNKFTRLSLTIHRSQLIFIGCTLSASCTL